MLVIGAGGLGAPLLLYLAAAGVGRIGIVDHDTVSLSNLQRQVIHSTGRIGMAKTESAAAADRPPSIRMWWLNNIQTRITPANALDLMSRYDIVADGCDNFPTRFMVSDAAFFARKHAGVCRRWPVRRADLYLQASSHAARWHALSHLSLLHRRVAAARLFPGLRGSGRARRAARH